ncbi:MAG TPA: hypothetical protein PLJ78_01770 [Anaerolineae bacterium]|nr:hypothetical protein [Anaerolineae bacterium]HQK12651.1 hypothetical protein [Anaerolineae bacterium]
MRRRAGSLLTAIALLITLWLIWSKLRIVVFVHMPWWGFLILGVLLFLAVDYILSKLFDRG